MTERQILMELANEDFIKNNEVYNEYILKKLAKTEPKKDELCETIERILKEKREFLTIKNILAEINNKEVSAAMLIPRLTKLYKNGVVEKTSITLADKSKVMSYGIKDN